MGLLRRGNGERPYLAAQKWPKHGARSAEEAKDARQGRKRSRSGKANGAEAASLRRRKGSEVTPPLLLNSLHRNTATHFPASARFVNACRALRPATRLPPLLPPLGQGALARRGAVPHSCDRQWLRDRGTRTEERREWRVFRRPGINSRRHDISGLCASKRRRNTDAFERCIERPTRTGSQPQSQATTSREGKARPGLRAGSSICSRRLN